MKTRIPGKGMTLWVCLLVLLIGQIVVACGGNTTTNGDGPVELTVWIYPASPEGSSPDADWELYKVVREKLNIDLKLSLIPLGGDGNSKLNAAAAANDLPDIFQITNNEIFLKWVDLGLVAPVNDLLPMMPERTKARYSNADVNKLYTINGQMYALQEPAQLSKRSGLIIRQDWLDKLGLKTPTTLDEMVEVAKAFTTRDPDGNGKNDTYGFGILADDVLGLGGKFNFAYGAYGLPGTWNYNTPGKVSLSVKDPNYMKGVEFFQRLTKERVIDPDWPTLKSDEFRARWKQGRYGIFSEDFSALASQNNYTPFDENFPDGRLVPIQPPKGPEGKSSLGTFTNLGFGMGISKAAMDAGKGPAIAKFLEWLNAGEGYYLAGFGKKDVNYKLDENGELSIEGLEVPFVHESVRKFIQMRNMVLNGSPSELKVRYPAFKTKSGRIQEPMKVYEAIAAMPWQDATSAYAIKPSPNQGDINRYINENLVQFINNQKPLNDSTWSTFVKGLDGLGVSEWEASANQTLKEKGYLK